MADKKQYASVSDALRDVAPDDAFQADFDQHVAERRLIKELLILRAARGLSQHDVAGFIGCSQGRISKLENAKDADVRFGYLQEYADAVGCDLVAQPVPRDMKPVDKVKGLTFAIKRHMDDLAQLAKTDEKIASGVAGFFHELFVNFTLMLGDSAKQLPRRSDESPYFDLQLGRQPSAGDDSSQTDCAGTGDALPASPR